MTPTSRHQQVEQALTDLDQAGTRVSIAPVTAHTDIARATLYLCPETPAAAHSPLHDMAQT